MRMLDGWMTDCVWGADDVQFGRALGRLRWENVVAESAMVRRPIPFPARVG